MKKRPPAQITSPSQGPFVPSVHDASAAAPRRCACRYSSPRGAGPNGGSPAAASRCGGTSLGRVKLEEDAEGVRRVSCGHKVRIIVARVYRLPRQEAA
jgi:hypothetical protein